MKTNKHHPSTPIAISPEIIAELKAVLMDCRQFFSDTAVQNIFELNESLHPWKNEVPSSDSTQSRVANVMAYFSSRFNDKHENALVLLVKAIHQDIHEKDDLKQRLALVLEKLETLYRGEAALDTFSVEVLTASKRLTVVAVADLRREIKATQLLDEFGVASAKSYLNVLSEMVAKEAVNLAAHAAASYSKDLFTRLIPLIVDLRWHRGYKVSLERLFNMQPTGKKVKDYSCEEVEPPCPLSEGILTAQKTEDNAVLVLLANHPAMRIKDLETEEMDLVLTTINTKGRLPAPEKGGLTTFQRIGAITLKSAPKMSQDEAFLLQNIDLLQITMARMDFPMKGMLLPADTRHPKVGVQLLANEAEVKGERINLPPEPVVDSEAHVEEFEAQNYFDVAAAARASLFSPKFAALVQRFSAFP